MVEAEKESEELKTMKEILKWIKITGMKEVKEVLVNSLRGDTRKLVYHYSDGTRGTKDFKDLVGVKSTRTVSDYWDTWKKTGIMGAISVKGEERGKKLFDLEDFGIEIPKITLTKSLPAQEVTQKEVDSTIGQEKEVSQNG